MISRPHLPKDYIERIVQRTLEEDVGTGDLTAALIPDVIIHAELISRKQAVLAGAPFFAEVFHHLDAAIVVEWKAEDGGKIRADQIVCTLTGPARSIVTGERSALNLLQTLSGTATTTHRYVEHVKGTKAKILDTRKTIPGLRLAQKYAVSCGGGYNHRMGLYDGILIKENHLRGGVKIEQILARARAAAQANILIEIEVENLAQLQAALDAKAHRILLDNFTLAQLQKAVVINAGRAKLEASGGIDLSNLRTTAETGVDYISIGAITKHVTAADFSLLATEKPTVDRP